MATKIRLQRHGRKGSPFYHIVVADARAPRDGRFIKRLGSYNPGTNPASVNIDFNEVLAWINKGAQLTDTCRSILSQKGIFYKKHLMGGVKKLALTEEEANRKFNQWLTQKEEKLVSRRLVPAGEREAASKMALAKESNERKQS